MTDDKYPDEKEPARPAHQSISVRDARQTLRAFARVAGGFVLGASPSAASRPSPNPAPAADRIDALDDVPPIAPLLEHDRQAPPMVCGKFLGVRWGMW
jgi:hypothetical protein